MIELSLIVCTRNRAVKLTRCLNHLTTVKSAYNWELIVVNNGSADNTTEVAATFARSASMPVTILHQPVQGLGRARNMGLAAAQGELVAFTDDDCYAAADYVDQVFEVFKDPKIGYGGGRIKLYDPSDYPITIKESETPQLIPPNTILQAGVVHGANMIFLGNRRWGPAADNRCRCQYRCQRRVFRDCISHGTCCRDRTGNRGQYNYDQLKTEF